MMMIMRGSVPAPAAGRSRTEALQGLVLMQPGVSPGGVWRRMGLESCSHTSGTKDLAATGEH